MVGTVPRPASSVALTTVAVVDATLGRRLTAGGELPVAADRGAAA